MCTRGLWQVVPTERREGLRPQFSRITIKTGEFGVDEPDVLEISEELPRNGEVRNDCRNAECGHFASGNSLRVKSRWYEGGTVPIGKVAQFRLRNGTIKMVKIGWSLQNLGELASSIDIKGVLGKPPGELDDNVYGVFGNVCVWSERGEVAKRAFGAAIPPASKRLVHCIRNDRVALVDDPTAVRHAVEKLVAHPVAHEHEMSAFTPLLQQEPLQYSNLGEVIQVGG